jgi:hypothetical protein
MDHARYFSADVDAGSRGGWNEQYTGTRFYTFDPRPEDVRIEDISHALGLQCRYNGNCKRFYSVAEHSCLLSDFVLYRGSDGAHPPDHGDVFDRAIHGYSALIALMHDAAEAYIGDMVRPVKHRMPAFRELEATIEAVVFPALGLPAEIPPWMRALDSRILCDERAQAMLTQHNDWSTDELEPLGVELQFWRPARAEYEFLRRFFQLSVGLDYPAARRRALRMVDGSSWWWGLLGPAPTMAHEPMPLPVERIFP